LLCVELQHNGFRTKIADEDADVLIVTTAIEQAKYDLNNNVIIIGNDTDLLVILNQLASDMNNVFFLKKSV